MKKLITTFALSLSFLLAYAQAPQSFNYQGVARSLSGAPLSNQNVSLRISILQASPNGNVVYAETQQASTNGLGLFQLAIGNGTPTTGLFGNINWGSNAHFLQIEMDQNGGNNYQLIGTSQLLSVPYALHAGNGSKWEDGPGNTIYYASGPVGVGTNSPQSNLDVVGSFRIDSQTNPNRDYRISCGARQEIYANNDLVTYVDGSAEFRVGLNVAGRGFNIRSGVDNQRFFFASADTKNIGIGMDAGSGPPQSKLQVRGGDVYIEDIDAGVIMKSPNGQCWRMTVSDAGQAEFTAITCPN